MIRASVEVDIDEELAACYADPLRYTLTFFPWGEPDGPLRLFTGPDPWQRQFLIDVGAAVHARQFDGVTPVLPLRFAVASAYGVGKTALMAWLTCWLMDTRPDAKGTITANTSYQLETKTWAAIQAWGAMRLTADRTVITTQRMYDREARASWFCAPTSCAVENSEAFAGQHNRTSTSFYGFDEGSAVDDVIYAVAEGGLTDGEPMIFVFGNPTRRTGQLYRAVFGSDRDRWNHRVISGFDCAFSNKALYQEWIETHGEDSDFVRVHVRGLPPNADELQYIDSERIGQAQRNTAQVLADEPLVAGVDVSGGGAAWTVCRFRRGADARTRPPLRWTGEQTMADNRQTLVAALAQVLRETAPDRKVSAMFVDSAYGAVLVSRLQQLGFRQAVEVNFGGPSGDRHDANLRAYMWRSLKEWLPQGAIDPRDVRLATDLAAPGHHLNPKNQLVLESKASMQTRGLASPDDGDALALTFALPVAMPRVATSVPPGSRAPRTWMR